MEESDGRKDLKFEEALAQLEELVGVMESGNIPLEDLIRGFERGSKLLHFCRSKLNAMERRIEILTRETAQGGEWQEFNAAAATPERNGEGQGSLPF